MVILQSRMKDFKFYKMWAKLQDMLESHWEKVSRKTYTNVIN